MNNNTKSHKKRNQAGFTLVELILYVGILVIILGATVLSSLSASNARIKALARHEVNYSTQFSMDILSQTIRRAQSIDSGASTFGIANSVLVLHMDNPVEEPTTFSLNGDQLTVVRGTDPAISIVSDHTVVTLFQVDNLSRGSKVRDVRVSLTIEKNNPSNLSQFNAVLSTIATMSLRQKPL